MLKAAVSAAVLATALAAAPVAAQQAPTLANPANTLLVVNGEGRSQRVPDLAVFSAGVTSQAKTAAVALSENSKAMNAVVAELTRAGIAARDIQTSNLSLQPVYTNPERDAMMAARMNSQPYVPPQPEQMIAKIVGYRADNTVVVRQRNLADYGKVIDALARAGANRIAGPGFQIENSQSALDEARVAAVKDARRRADLIAEAAGLRIVRTISINENGAYIPQPMMADAIVVTGSSIGAPPPPPPPPPPTQGGELSANANVSIQYELAPR